MESTQTKTIIQYVLSVFKSPLTKTKSVKENEDYATKLFSPLQMRQEI